MDFRQPSERIAKLAKELVDNEESLAHIKASSVKIAYLQSESEKRSSGKTVYAQCERVPDKYRWAINYDFTITVYMPNVERFTDEQVKILMLHELYHVGIEKDGNEETYRTIPHDIEDFKAIIERYGLTWSE